MRATWACALLAALTTGCSTGRPPIPLEALGPAIHRPTPVHAWVTTADGSRRLAQERDLELGTDDPLPTAIEIDATQRFQEIVGFGAAMTDASALLIDTRLSREARRALLGELFGAPPGLGLSMARIAIGASDFSERHYSLDDLPPGESDPALQRFSIEPNRAHLLPVLRAARALNPGLKIIGSPWSPPAWMKDSGSLIKGQLQPANYATFADYLVRFADAYERERVPLYALTVQNEPGIEPGDYPGMRFEAQSRARFIGQFLGPRLARRRHPLAILDWDHNWDRPESPLAVLADPDASRYVTGIAWHCYAGKVAAQSTVHEAYPDRLTFLTECSGGEWLRSWDNALRLAAGTWIIGATRHWASGVILWNIALDERHGPHLGGCPTCRGLVTIDQATGAVTRNVEYYVLGHASRFVRPGARRVESTTGVEGLESVAFRNADDGSVVLIVLNTRAEPRRFSVVNLGRTFAYELPAGSVATFVWAPPG